MKTKCSHAALVLVLAALGLHTVHGQEQQCRRLYFSALDRSDKPVAGLSAADFRLTVGRRNARLEGFRAALPATDKSVPVIAWVLVDFNPNVNAAVIERQSLDASAIFDLFHPDSLIGIRLVSDRLETLAPPGHDPVAIRDAFTTFARKRTQLAVNPRERAIPLGSAGILSAIDYSLDDLAAIAREPRWRDREVRRAIMILSDGNVNPGIKPDALYHKASAVGVFLYPVFVPRPRYGSWLQDYFDLAWKTGGVPSVFGALSPGASVARLSRPNTGPNALTFNFIHMMRDLNGKYSFCAPPSTRIGLKCKVKHVKIHLPA